MSQIHRDAEGTETSKPRRREAAKKTGKEAEYEKFPGLWLEQASADSTGAVVALTAWLDQGGRLVSFKFDPIDPEQAEAAALAAYNLAIRNVLKIGGPACNPGAPGEGPR